MYIFGRLKREIYIYIHREKKLKIWARGYMDVSCIILIYSLKNYEQKEVCKVY